MTCLDDHDPVALLGTISAEDYQAGVHGRKRVPVICGLAGLAKEAITSWPRTLHVAAGGERTCDDR
jgi:hypothetical protein